MVKLYDKGVYLINGGEIAETPEEVKGKTGPLLEIMEPQLVLRDKEKQEEWLKKGEFKTLYGLVRDNLISIESAAARQNLTVEEFQAKLQELDII